MKIQSYRDLKVWQSSMDLVELVYKMTRSFPTSEKFGLMSQMQRAAVSIPSNIAEGAGRNHTKEYLHHLAMAYGSLMELETQIQIAVRLKYLTKQEVIEAWTIASETGQMLNKLMVVLKAKL